MKEMCGTRSRQSKQWAKRLPVAEFHLARPTLCRRVLRLGEVAEVTRSYPEKLGVLESRREK